MSGTEEPFDAGNAKHVSERARKAKRRRAEHDSVVLEIMRTTPGRRWMWDLLSECGVFRSCFSPDALVMAKAEGERNIGLRLTAEVMRLAPADYVVMMTENTEKVSDNV